MKLLVLIGVVCLIVGYQALGSQLINEGRFECLGVPVTKALLMKTAVGPDATGQKECLYFNFAQTGARLFLVAVDPDTGEARQYKAPVGPGAWALIRGPDDKMYLGTWESGYILRFDPAAPDRGIQVLGKPSATETYIWEFAIGKDGKLYGCTYGQAKLVSCDPKTDRLEDLGRMDDTQMYTRSIACGPTGKIYTGIGYGRANVVAYDPTTKSRKSILPDQYRTNTSASVHLGADGEVYASCGSQNFRVQDEALIPIDASPVSAQAGLVLRDGRTVTVGIVSSDTCGYTLTDPRTGVTMSRTFHYQGDGAMLFVVATGPDGKVYGSTAMPLEMFVHDPIAKTNASLGNPTPVNGEIYSMVPWREKLYVCAYPGAYLSAYDPARPFRFGTNATDNPRGLGYLGDGHLRPRAIALGQNNRLYIGSLPPYGELGGALAVFDLEAGRVAENYRHLVTNQSIVALAWDPNSGLVLGGSSVTGGGGTLPGEREARFFVFDPRLKAKVFETALATNIRAYPAICVARQKVFVAAGKSLHVFDPVTCRSMKTIALPGGVLEISLGLHGAGVVIGLTSQCVFAVDVRSGELISTAESPVPITCGFALADNAVYFGSGRQLWRYVIPATIAQSASGSN